MRLTSLWAIPVSFAISRLLILGDRSFKLRVSKGITIAFTTYAKNNQLAELVYNYLVKYPV